MNDLITIIKGCTNNNSGCQKQLYEQFYGYALKTVFRYIYHYDKAVDVTNDGFVKIFIHLKNFNAADDDSTEKIFMGWVKRIMINTAIDELRKNQFVPEIGEITKQSWEPADKSETADKLVLYKEVIEHVRHLPPSYRTVFNMYVIDGFTHQEIANHLGISVGASKSNLSKAKAHLKKSINKDEQEADVCNM